MRIALFTWFSLFVMPCLCILKEDIFKVDWQNIQIGIPLINKEGGSHDLTTSSILQLEDKIIVLTLEGVLAAIQKSTGQLSYRFQTDEKIRYDSHLASFQDSIVSVFNYEQGSSDLTFWTQDDNVFLIKEAVHFSSPIIGLYPIQDSKMLVVLENGEIMSFSSNLNKTTICSPDDTQYIRSKIFTSQYGDFAIVLTNFAGTSISKVLSAELEISQANPVSCSIDLMTSIGDDSFICQNSHFFTFFDGKFTSKKVSGTDKKVISSSSQYITFSGPKIVDSITGNEIRLESNVQHVGKYGDNLIAITETSVHLLDSFSLESGSLFAIPLELDLSKVLAYSLNIMPGNKFDIFIVKKDYTLDYYGSAGDLLWSRDESLAYIQNYTVLDKSEELELTIDELKYEYDSNILVGIITRLQHNFKLLKSKLLSFKDDSLTDFGLDGYFGLAKSLIILTSNGKLFALDTQKVTEKDRSQVKWTFDTGLGDQVSQIYSLKSSQGYELIISTILGEYYIMDAFGDSLSLVKDPSKYFITLISPDNETKVVLKDESVPPEFSVLQASDDKQTLIGYYVSQESQNSTWTYTASPGESILNVALRDYGNDRVSSIGVVLGDRKVLYKYLVPDLAVVSIYNEVSNVLKTQIINMITGEVYKTITNEEISIASVESLQVVFSENFVIYSMINPGSTTESTVYVIDLFESLTPDVKWSGSLGTVLPEVAVRSYLFTGKILKLAVTKTRYNISSKFIIAYLESNEVVSIPRWFLSGRRVTGRDLTNYEKQEFRMLKYDPLISLNEKFTLNHYRTLLRRFDDSPNLISIPSSLESTSIVCSLGLDIFCTQVKPSGAFDYISASFDKKTLVATVILLTVAAMVTRPYVSRKKLAVAWKTNL